MRARSMLEPGGTMAVLTALLSMVVPARGADADRVSAAPGFTLSSPDLSPGGRVPRAQVYDRNGCRGANRSPALTWAHPPAETRGFAVLIFDSDAAGGWWHWLVIDIPAGIRALPSGAGGAQGLGLPAGARQTRNDYGSIGYGGPCPPPGPAHHYHVLLYALGVAHLALAADAPPGVVAAAVQADSIAKTQITVSYGR